MYNLNLIIKKIVTPALKKSLKTAIWQNKNLKLKKEQSS